MRIAYLECFAGVSGDMFLGALIDAGVDPQILQNAIAGLRLGASLRRETVDRSGISSTKVHVMEGEHLAEHAPAAGPKEDEAGGPTHRHGHGRSLAVIRRLIDDAALDAPVKRLAIEVFELLGASEAKIHNVPVDQIHFHEVGAVDAIVDIVAASAGIHALGVERWYCSPLNVGSGMVDCAHGRFPVPAPATADLLKGLPTYSANLQMELVTPTGAALIRALGCSFGQQPAMRVERIGYGAGSRNPAGFPNVLRLNVGEMNDANKGDHFGTVVVMETAIDDLSPQILAHVTEAALTLGALDVMCTAVQMKKGRLGTLVTILTDRAHAPALERLLLRETSTLGIRIHTERRSCLERTHVPVTTPFGEIRMKIGSLHGEELNAAPEFEDCRAAAIKYQVPVKLVIQAATAAYVTGKVQ